MILILKFYKYFYIFKPN